MPALSTRRSRKRNPVRPGLGVATAISLLQSEGQSGRHRLVIPTRAAHTRRRSGHVSRSSAGEIGKPILNLPSALSHPVAEPLG